jgi:hypothetical protein
MTEKLALAWFVILARVAAVREESRSFPRSRPNGEEIDRIL